MSLSLTGRILSVCRGGGWSRAAVSRRRDEPRESCRQILAHSGAAQSVVIDCFGLTDIGRVRAHNEDQFLIADLTRPFASCQAISSNYAGEDGERKSNADLLLVADGVGGNAGGERASRLAVEGVVEYLHVNRKRLWRDAESRGDQVLEDLKSALAWARQRIQREAEASPDHSRMGTTLTLAYLAWPAAYVAHVGDSRAYVYRRQKLLQLTHDQTIAQMLADAGTIRADCVKRHPFRHTLGSLMGWNPKEFHPCVNVTRLEGGDQLLLCTDGLTERVTNSHIAEILTSSSSAEQACRELIATANAAGGTDNTTVVVARFCERIFSHDAAASGRGVRERESVRFAPPTMYCT